MAVQIRFRPIEKWPGEPTKTRKSSQFDSSYEQTLRLLKKEVEYLGGKEVVIQLDTDGCMIRLDGSPRAGMLTRSPKVIVSFESKHGPLSYPADRYYHWQDNLRGIALSLEALRSVDRYGVTRRAEQYRGWERVEHKPTAEKTARERAVDLFRELSAAGVAAERLTNREALDGAFRQACLRTHPDRGGSAEAFKQVQLAYEVLKTFCTN